MSQEDFIQLDRIFVTRSQEQVDLDYDTHEARFILGFDKGIPWEDLLGKYRVVILAEAGTGKTEELKHAARKLRAEGKSAFFLRLENIISHFEYSFEIGTYEEFQDCCASSAEFWLFLDSVDECCLKSHNDFELAVRIVAKNLATAKEKAHIFLTSRVSAWRPKEDLAYCNEKLAPEEQEQAANNLDTIKDININFLVVGLTNLTRQQVKLFAAAKQVAREKEFFEELTRQEAWHFTERPQDLEELIDYWKANGKVGSRRELMEHSVACRLKERDPARAQRVTISDQRILEGAQRLAAVATLAKIQSIAFHRSGVSSQSLFVEELLPDWTEAERNTLLQRPLFDPGTHGTVRFHHRSQREYLTAKWFQSLLEKHTSRRKIESLFFTKKYAVSVVRPALRPVLAWLVLFDDRMCQLAEQIVPEVFFEGGDPSKLSLPVRKRIFQSVCEQIQADIFKRTITDNSSVLRFVTPDLADDVKEMFARANGNDEFLWFLLRMVYYGKLQAALSEATALALNPEMSEATRIGAFQAVYAVGSAENGKELRKTVLQEAHSLSRKLVVGLVEGAPRSTEVIQWILQCSQKVEPAKPLSSKGLSFTLAEYIASVDIPLLPEFLMGVANLLGQEPFIEKRHCEVSKHHAWLLLPAAKALIRLIENKNPFVFTKESLGILHRFATLNSHDGRLILRAEEEKKNLQQLVQGWTELNLALFLFEADWVNQQRSDEGKARAITKWELHLHSPLWDFGERHFSALLETITVRIALEDKVLLFEEAYYVYKQCGENADLLAKLHQVATTQKELSEWLIDRLTPPPIAPDQPEWKREQQQYEAKKAENLALWKLRLEKGHSLLRAGAFQFSETENNLAFLYDCLDTGEFWVQESAPSYWEMLRSVFGEDIATAYREGLTKYWRFYQPVLCSEKQAYDLTWNTLWGLAGLELEARQNAHWYEMLTPAEAKLACRYAIYNLNGFPQWFPAFYERHAETLLPMLEREMEYELREAGTEDMHYIVYKICHEPCLIDALAPACLTFLESRRDVSLFNLQRLFSVLQKSSVPKEHLVSLVHKQDLIALDQFIAGRWFGLWLGLEPEAAFEAFDTYLQQTSDMEGRTKIVTILLGSLTNAKQEEIAPDKNPFCNPNTLKKLYLLAHQYIRTQDDINRAGQGSYYPTERDDAQKARDGLGNMLRNIPGQEAYAALVSVANEHPVASYKNWFAQLSKERAEQDADITAWQPKDIIDFQETLERTPKNHKELEELVEMRLLDLKDYLEEGDDSPANVLIDVEETKVRNVIGGRSREQSLNRYSLPQEEELADDKRMDLRFHGKGFDAPIPVELKVADKWSGPDLFERLENQLCGDYLRDSRSRHGFFLLVKQGRKPHWELPSSGRRVSFPELIESLEGHWEQLRPDYPGIDSIKVIGIDLTKRLSSKGDK